MPARIAAIILNLNRCDMTSECIHSLAATNSQNLQIIVVDNGSSEDSVEVFRRRFPNMTVLPQSRNMGFAAGCNVGIRHAIAEGFEYVLLLNNDTFAAPDFVPQMLAAIQSNSRVAAVCPKIYFANSRQMLWYAGGDFSLWTGLARHRGWKAIDQGQFDRQREITHATGCALLVRCSALHEVGLLDEQFWAYAEDLDWSIRFRKKGYGLVFAPKARLWHHDGATAVQALGSGTQALRQFFSTRNMVFVARKHVSWWQIPSYAFGFLINHIAFYTFLRIWKRDFRALWAIYRGLIQGLRTPLVIPATELFDVEIHSNTKTQACVTESASGPFTA
jgi:GT2 family glycosyltransferase